SKERCAPVITTGFLPVWKSSKAIAVSSMESVPWVITTPAMESSASNACTRCSRSSRSVNDKDEESRRTESTGEISTSDGVDISCAASTSSAAETVGTKAPLASVVQAMVPPVATTAIILDIEQASRIGVKSLVKSLKKPCELQRGFVYRASWPVGLTKNQPVEGD